MDVFISDLLRLITLEDANTRVVLYSTTLLGISAGLAGTFSLLRKRALVGDAISHAAFPGICLAFIIFGGKFTPALLMGAFISGILGVLCLILLRTYTRVSDDASLGIILSSFFGVGIVLSSFIQQSGTVNQSGLDTFIYGKAAAMLYQDAITISIAAILTIFLISLFFKELVLICFDPLFSKACGWPVLVIDLLLMALVTVIVIVGLQAVGVVLIISLLITPAASARFWTDRIKTMAFLSGLFGGLSAAAGTVLSAVFPKAPTGPLIVIVAAAIFFLSLVVAPKKGLLSVSLQRSRTRERYQLEHLLRSGYEILERGNFLSDSFSVSELQTHRPWPKKNLSETLGRATTAKYIVSDSKHYKFTETGLKLARKVVRNHRLWELYLISFASAHPDHVDIGADAFEHMLDPQMTEELQSQLSAKYPELDQATLTSPHKL